MAINTNQTTDTLTPSTGTLTVASSDVTLSTVGKGIKINESTNGRMGQAQLNGAGTVTVSNTSVTANSRIFLSYADKGSAASGLTEPLWISSIVAGTSFTIKSGLSGTSAGDALVNWIIFEPA